jgi:hypothetical protein
MSELVDESLIGVFVVIVSILGNTREETDATDTE